jgi:hypothetical protein
MELTLSEQLTYSTVRIECNYRNGKKGTGTGYFFRFKDNKEAGTHIPVLITNKHVIINAGFVRLIFSKSNDKGEPLDSVQEAVCINDFDQHCQMHPDDDVDLCALALYPYIANTANLFYIALDMSLIPSSEELADLTALEDIIMIGYPNGLWDSKNNKPILRKGITATHIAKDYCGKKEFMIDAACFPGSSGSPVFLLNEGAYQHRTGMRLGNRIKLLGTLYAGPQYLATGEIKVVEVPTINVPMAISMIPINLGLVIKSERIIELEILFNE